MADDRTELSELDESFDGIRIIGGESAGDDVSPGRSVFGDDSGGEELPPWTAPPTGQVPAPPPADDWASLNREGPRWADADEVAIEPIGPMTPEAPVGQTESAGGEQFFSFDDGGDTFRDFDERVPDFDPAILPPESESLGAPVAVQSPPDAGTTYPDEVAAPSEGSDRNIPMAVGTAGVLIALAALAFAVGPWAVMVLATVVLGLAAAEFLNAVRVAGYNPPVLLGVSAVVFLSLAVYWRHAAAYPVVLFLTFVFGALWYLTGVSTERPVANLAVTFFGVVWIGVFGSFAALMLSTPPNGRGFLFAALLCTAAYDTGAWGIGRAMGRQPLSPASPNKTLEGLIGGCVAAVVAGLVVWLLGVAPFDDFLNALLLGVVVAIVAPIGDLAESLFKRDLGLKDMGTFLPGHGGLLDRFDSLLFVLPAVYYLALLRVF